MGIISNGTTVFDAGAMALGGSITFIKKLTASSSSTLSFVDGSSGVTFDSTYKQYMFTFKNMHPSADQSEFQFNLSADSGSNYNVTKTSTPVYAYMRASDGANFFGQDSNARLAQSTGFQSMNLNANVDNYSSLSGYLMIFNPASTTFHKHFISETIEDANTSGESGLAQHFWIAGYGNTTSACDAIQFKYNSGNMDAGDICLYGIN